MKQLVMIVTMLAVMVVAVPAQAAKPVQGPEYFYPGVSVNCEASGVWSLSAFPGDVAYYEVTADNKVYFSGVIGPYLTLANSFKNKLTVHFDNGYVNVSHTYYRRMC